ncbi:MAG: hypothetical protein R3C99_02580 [Pirellulaceae bacterium]
MATIMEKLDPYQAWLGLSPDELPANHYSLLGIDPGEGSRDAISRAAEQRMDVVRSHLDGPDAAAARRLLNELTRAAGCLLNPAERVAYDRRLRRAAEAAEEAEAEPAPPASPPASPPISSTSPPISPVASAASAASAASPVAETTAESTPAEGQHGSAKSRKPLPQSTA